MNGMSRLESNHLAVDIFEQGGIWKVENADRKLLVEIVGLRVAELGMIVLDIRALEGKPFMRTIDYGDGFKKRFRSEYSSRLPEYLIPLEKTE